MAKDKPKALVLLSGGMDSAVTAAYAIDRGYEVYALTFDYQQRHRIEIEYAKRIAQSLGVARHIVFELDLRQIGGSALTCDEIPVSRGSDDGPLAHAHGSDSENQSHDHENINIPITYVPARNTIFLSIALGFAEVLECDAVFIGANAIDYSGYPDCRPEYIRRFQSLADIATKATAQDAKKIKIEAPLLNLSKAQIIGLGISLGIDFAKTWSCYDPLKDGTPCGKCDACLLRERGFNEYQRQLAERK